MKLGQHFLKNKRKLRKIADALELKGGDVVVEIGPGHGELTRELARTFDNKHLTSDKNQGNGRIRIIAIEKDEKLAENLREKLNQDKRIKIITGDVLKVLPSVVRGQGSAVPTRYKCVGNIPYYITGKLMRILGDLVTSYGLRITTIVLTVQKEVGERICARPPGMNLLAASVQFWANVKIIANISRKEFKPQPKVDSVVIRMTTRNDPGTSPTPRDGAGRSAKQNAKLSEKYYKIIKILFKQPRKTILNNLKNLRRGAPRAQPRGSGQVIPNAELITLLKKTGIDPQARPQDLDIETIKNLAKILQNRV